ncbi:DNA-directed RNA polymerase, subunit M, archaeal [Tasmannia lanceolata]|uniref:DNA-directed RNA polymerase, subunit M, archaeal n=1 Tax=Tasmannia lanceolata TaxID=3420 RepID=UPI0040633589
MEFCPFCGNMLLIEKAQMGRRSRLFCPTCPYVSQIHNEISRKKFLVKKEDDAVFSGEEAKKNASKTEASCPKCNFGEAYFFQMQTRSADEPMSTFYKCCSCEHKWKED